MLDLTDEEIVLAVRGGDMESFGFLVERYEPKIRRYAKKFLLEGDEAKDIVQEVFLKAYVNIRSFDPARKFSPWLYRIAHNEFLNAIRKRSGRKMISIFDLDVMLPPLFAREAADTEVNRRELKETLDAHLGKLDPKYREPLVLYYYEEMNYEEMADILQIPVATVGVRLSRGRAALKKMMPDYSPEQKNLEYGRK